MKRRNFIKSFGAASCALSLPLSLHAGQSKTAKPNFLFILVDDLGWADLGCYGSTYHETPNLDKLAKSGMLFTDGYASCPVCSPTRASLMTGKYPARLNITDWIPGNNPKNRKLLGPEDIHELPLSEVTIAESLKKGGYKTFFAGKWHLGDEGFYPEDQGFEINKGGHHKGSPPGGYYSPWKNPKLENGPEGEYLPDRLTNESIKFLENNKENQFLLYLSFYTVHTPIQACKRHLKKFEKKLEALPDKEKNKTAKEHDATTRMKQDNPAYASMVYAMDENVGRLLDKLEELKLSDNTVIMFTGDNGGLSTKKNIGPTSNAPLRAGKGWCYEGGIREPFIIRAPGMTKPESKSSELAISTDFYPTMLELAGLKAMPKQHADGVSLVPALQGKKLDREAIYWHYPHYHGSTWTPGAAVRAGDWKLIEFYDLEKVELYNLKEDIGERNELSKKNPEKTKELLTLLHNWQKDVGAKMPTPNPNFKE